MNVNAIPDPMVLEKNPGVEFITLQKAIRLMGMSRQTIYNLIYAKRLRPYKLGKLVLFKISDLNQLIEPKGFSGDVKLGRAEVSALFEKPAPGRPKKPKKVDPKRSAQRKAWWAKRKADAAAKNISPRTQRIKKNAEAANPNKQ